MKNNDPKKVIKQDARPEKSGSYFDSFAERFISLYQVFIFVVIIICILATSLFLFSIYNKKIKPVQNEIVVQAGVLETKQDLFTDYESSSKKFSDLTDFEQKIMQILPLSQRKDILFVEFEAIANKNNLTLQSINIAQTLTDQEEVDKNDLSKMSVDIGLSGGNYFEMKNFIKDVENSLRIIEIKSINYTPDSDLFTISAETYYYAK
ncbi:type 4a pilus biogenesis protein PilO [Candidatus Falkowbacteria bacterium]|jgi:Tfp pilus assembly protein PilO|nr:type 4a pilus biogenesis protein PilO [Candidatus Falkowbacteria bacterium]MBT7007355.1 type 4a pilus biogenesis protein PilO [Candidatus Falkowbacteria bacterium]